MIEKSFGGPAYTCLCFFERKVLRINICLLFRPARIPASGPDARLYLHIDFFYYLYTCFHCFLAPFLWGVSVLDCSIGQSPGHEITVVLITLGNGNDSFTGQALSCGWGSAGVTWHVGEDFATE